MRQQRITFEQIAFLDEMLSSSMQSINDIEYIRNEYFDLLNMFGWTQKDYETELLKKIDREWSSIHCEVVLGNTCLN